MTADAVHLTWLRAEPYSATSSRRARPASAASPCTVNDLTPCTACDPVGSSSSTPSSSPSAARIARTDSRRPPSSGRARGRPANTSDAAGRPSRGNPALPSLSDGSTRATITISRADGVAEAPARGEPETTARYPAQRPADAALKPPEVRSPGDDRSADTSLPLRAAATYALAMDRVDAARSVPMSGPVTRSRADQAGEEAPLVLVSVVTGGLPTLASCGRPIQNRRPHAPDAAMAHRHGGGEADRDPGTGAARSARSVDGTGRQGRKAIDSSTRRPSR